MQAEAEAEAAAAEGSGGFETSIISQKMRSLLEWQFKTLEAAGKSCSRNLFVEYEQPRLETYNRDVACAHHKFSQFLEQNNPYDRDIAGKGQAFASKLNDAIKEELLEKF